MDAFVGTFIKRAVGADELFFGGTLQSLWSGYGSIDRYRLSGGQVDSVILKHVRLPLAERHPRGWHNVFAQQRKLRSYQVEAHWYRAWAARCGTECRIPRCYALERNGDEVLILLEDLDASGYPIRCDQAGQTEIHLCLDWLAHFHARFLGVMPTGLWPVGTYWHLDTRPDEWAAMPEGKLKQGAAVLDRRLTTAPFQTLVHGDAKLANFCFSAEGSHIAAVDFQYVGGGCGMKDVAYFISSCLDEVACERQEQQLLDFYFRRLAQALARLQPKVDAAAVEAAWRPLYAVAWTDFFRFLQGWSPGHWKIHRYSERLADEVLAQIQPGA